MSMSKKEKQICGGCQKYTDKCICASVCPECGDPESKNPDCEKCVVFQNEQDCELDKA